MVVDGNDDRGIDVGVLTTAAFPLGAIRSHVDDADTDGQIFSRDCPEYEITTPAGRRIVLLVNHFKSKGFGGQRASDHRRLRQAARVADIYRRLREEATEHVVVLGDLNDTPTSTPLAPLLADTDLRDVSGHPGFDDGGRPGTFGNATATNKIDYILLSPALWARTTGGGILRKGVWGGIHGTLWPIYPTMTKPVHAASDHAAIYADIDLD
jgi:endonuclease/exonuclease/phosphatase family metal-dependent hydrolase